MIGCLLSKGAPSTRPPGEWSRPVRVSAPSARPKVLVLVDQTSFPSKMETSRVLNKVNDESLGVIGLPFGGYFLKLTVGKTETHSTQM
jgi:hypothetical protein